MLAKSVKMTASGSLGGLAYRVKKALNVPQAPTFLIYQATNQCNSRCRMCNIWKKDSKGELSAADIGKLFRKPLFRKLRWVNLTGGEPFMRKDIVKIVEMLCSLPRFEGVAIPTNGFLTERIVSDAGKILKLLGSRFLSITVSLDGYEKTHDEIRGVPGAYKKAIATIEKLLELKKKYPNFNIGIQPTISKLNLDEMPKFYREMKKKTGSVGFAVMMESEGYYGNTGSDIALSQDDKKKVAAILKTAMRQDPQYAFYYSKLIELFKTGNRNFGCLAGYITMYMDPYGNVSPCPVLSCEKRYSYGNIRDRGVWEDKKAAQIRKMLKKEPVCRKCSMMCDFINVAKVEFFEHSLWMLQHPKAFSSLMAKISSEKNPYF